jgi:hypothetical protein
MTDADRQKCRLIARFEGLPTADIKSGDVTRDYPVDLRATMRAARKLPADYELIVGSGGSADVYRKSNIFVSQFVKADPARAAFEALSAYLEAKP